MEITLEESTTDRVSLTLQKIVEQVLLQNQGLDSVQKDLFFVLIIVLMVENGFVLVENETEIEDIVTFFQNEGLTKNKTHLGAFEVQYFLQGFKRVPLKLIMSSLGATVLVNVVINELGETYTACLPVGKYVVSPQASTIAMIFRDLQQLSSTFKNNITAAVKSSILSYCGYPSASLIGIPEEVLFKIIKQLPVAAVINVSKTCRRLKYIIDNNILWHCLYKRDFKGLMQEPDDFSSWKNFYIQAYKEKVDKELRNLCKPPETLQDLMEYYDYASYIENQMWDVN